jgi:hypothetical protein
MANRYPLILDTADANKIKELQTGDNLNLADNSIIGVQNITALGTIDAAVITVNGNRLVAQTFAQLSDTPNSYTGNANKFVSVNAAGTAIEYKALSAFGIIDVSSIDITGDILPETNNVSILGSTTKKFAGIHAVDVYGNLKDYNGTLVFNATTGKIQYASIENAPTNVSEFTNDVGFATTAGINQYIQAYFDGGSGNALQVDITGSVFADDSTVMIDAVAGKIVGDIHYPTIGSITAGTKVQLGTTELTSTIEPPTTNTGAIGTTTKRFGTGYFQNINASGNVTAATFNGTLNGIVIGDVTGSVFGDDSSVLVDAVSGVHYGQLVGDVTGSVFADDSGVIIDGINAKVVGAIETTSLRTNESAIALGKNAGKTSHGTRAIAIGEDAGETSQGGNAIGIGTDAGKTSQGSASIAIGASAGLTGQSVNSIAIGASAGTTNLAQNSIIINATGAAVQNTTVASLVIKPIRSAPNAYFLKYNVGSGEITYEADAAGVFTGDLTGSVFADDSTLLVDGVNARHNFPNNVIADLSNVSANSPSVGQVLKWDGAQWAPAVDATSGGGGLDADTLNGQNGAYYLAWGNFASTPTTIAGYGITDSITNASTNTFTNKTIDQDGTGNNITNLANASIKAAAGIDATKIADGTVTSTEFQYIGGLTSDAQTQITAKAALTDISVALGGASGSGSIAYNNATGVLTLSPADLTSINIVSDTSPQLGGTLDANGNTIDMGVNVIDDSKVGNWNTAYGWGDHASASYLTAITGQNLSNLADVHTTAPTNGQVLTWDQSNTRWAPASAGSGGSIGNFTFSSSNIDTDDSSGITLTPAITFESDVTVQNDLVVNNTVTANKFVSSAVGSPKITSATNIELNAGGVVVVGSSALRLYSVTTTQRNALTASTGDIIYNSTLMKYQVRIGSAWKSLTIADDVPTNNNQLSNGAGYLTSVPAPTSTFTMTSNGSSDYVFAQDSRYFPIGAESDPVLYVRRGETYNFVNNSGGSHPFQIRTSNGGGAYNTGVTNNGAASGTISWTVPMTAPSSVYYQCTAHSGMGNTINIVT